MAAGAEPAEAEPCAAVGGAAAAGAGHSGEPQEAREAPNALDKVASSASGALVRRGSRAIAAVPCGGSAGAGSAASGSAPSSMRGGRPPLAAAAICTVAIHELNEEAIELIFTFLPPEDCRSAAAVCRLWRRVHNSSTKLWGSVLLSGERIVQAAASASAGSITAWLSARLEAMRAVRLWSPCHPLESFASGLAQLLSREGRLQAFSYAGADASVSRLLSELPGLTSLQLLDILAPALAGPGQGLVVRARELAKLKPLRNLLSLQLRAREIRGSLPPALFRCLNRLQHLAITAKCRLPAGVVRQLTGLQSLELHGASLDDAAVQAVQASLQQLTHLGISVQGWHQLQQELDGWEEPGGSLGGAAAGGSAGSSSSSSRRRGGGAASDSGSADAGGAGGSKRQGGGSVKRWQEHPIWGQLPLLARLQCLCVGAELPEPSGMGLPGDGSGDDDGGGGGVGLAGAGAAAVLPYDLLEGSVPDGIMDCRSLTHLVLPVALTCLPDMVPGQLPRLAQLDLTHSIVEALPPSWCCNMQVLRRLVLNGAQLAGSRLPAEFAALQGLRHLEMRACRLEVLPSCVAQLHGLTHLDVGINRLSVLPPGPYLGQLKQLVARGNALQALPRVLAEAEQLEMLDVGENEGLVLQASDVDGLLARMPALRLLVLSRQPAGFGFGPYISASTGAAWDAQSVSVLMHLARALPSLTVQLERTAGPHMPPRPAATDPPVAAF